LPTDDNLTLNQGCDGSLTYLNHGQCGLTLRCALQSKREWAEYIEGNSSDRFLLEGNANGYSSSSNSSSLGEVELLSHMVARTRQWAQFLGVPWTEAINLLPFTDVNTALSSVARAWMKSGRDGKLVHLDITDGITKKVLEYMASETHSRRIEVPIEFDDDKILTSLEQHCVGASFVVLDHITSSIAAALPISEMIPVVRRVAAPGCIIFVDGGQAAGPTMMDNLYRMYRDSDFWATNGHQWLCGPKGTGVMYRNPKCELRIEPPIISQGLIDGEDDDGVSGFYSQEGAHDVSSILALDATFHFWETINASTSSYYNNSILIEGSEFLEHTWGTDLLAPQKFCTTMSLVRLPGGDGASATYDDAQALQKGIYEKGIVVAIEAFRGSLYVRLSAQIYNDMSDFEALAKAIEELKSA